MPEALLKAYLWLRMRGAVRGKCSGSPTRHPSTQAYHKGVEFLLPQVLAQIKNSSYNLINLSDFVLRSYSMYSTIFDLDYHSKCLQYAFFFVNVI
jgi:hypothetical protein